MCGISGAVGPKASEALARRMSAVQSHRGPDGAGAWAAPGVCLGHNRLAILDLSPAGAQPMASSDGRYVLSYNGEVYNYRELRAELGGAWRTETDTEVVLRAWERWGPDCLKRFVGMFAFALWDSRERALYCVRDRLGIKPFHFAQDGGTFLFASEIRPLLAAGVPARAEAGVLHDFLARDFYDHGDDTFFAGVRRLPPGTWLRVEDGVAGAPTRWWDLAADSALVAPSGDRREREERLLSLCADAVSLHLRSDVPVGVALSGGLDSAALLALLDRGHPDPAKVESFSFVFADPAYSERPFVEAMAAATGRRAHFSALTPESFRDRAAADAASQEEPFAGLPISSYAACFEDARRAGFIVLMDGSGVDEAMAGYERFRPAHWADLRAAGRDAELTRELKAVGAAAGPARAAALAAADAAASPSGDVGRGQDLTRSVRPEALAGDFARAAARPAPAFASPFPDALRSLMHRELRYTKLPRALRFRDRLSMAAGCELRPPFLDHRLLAFLFALPAEDRIRLGRTKDLLRSAAERLLPDAVRLAAKRSVQTPQREWLRGPLAGWVRDIVDAPRFWERGWVDRAAGRAAMEAFLRGEGDNSFFLWQWVNLELWARRFLDAPAKTI